MVNTAIRNAAPEKILVIIPNEYLLISLSFPFYIAPFYFPNISASVKLFWLPCA